MVKQCNNCKHWRLGTASLDDNYCNLTSEWADYEGYCDNWEGYSIENLFTVGYFDEPTNIDDYVECNGGYLSSSEVVELLNELYEERNYFERKKCEYQKKISILITDKIQLKQENEQLKFQNSNLMKEVAEYSRKAKELELEVFNLEQIIKTGKMPVENKEVLILIAKELYYLITHKGGSADLQEIVKLKNRIEELEGME